jgi:hypothetical protein
MIPEGSKKNTWNTASFARCPPNICQTYVRNILPYLHHTKYIWKHDIYVSCFVPRPILIMQVGCQYVYLWFSSDLSMTRITNFHLPQSSVESQTTLHYKYVMETGLHSMISSPYTVAHTCFLHHNGN